MTVSEHDLDRLRSALAALDDDEALPETAAGPSPALRSLEAPPETWSPPRAEPDVEPAESAIVAPPTGDVAPAEESYYARIRKAPPVTRSASEDLPMTTAHAPSVARRAPVHTGALEERVGRIAAQLRARSRGSEPTEDRHAHGPPDEPAAEPLSVEEQVRRRGAAVSLSPRPRTKTPGCSGPLELIV